MKKRFLSFALILCMMLTMLPVNAYAADAVCEIRNFDNEVIYTITGVYKCPSNHSSAVVEKIESQDYSNYLPCMEDCANKTIKVKCSTQVYCRSCNRTINTGFQEISFTDPECCHRSFMATKRITLSNGGTVDLTLNGYFFGNLETHDEVPATCTSTGTKAYWKCVKGHYENSPEGCNKRFLDAECTQEVTSDSDLVISKKSHSPVHHEGTPKKDCSSTGIAEYWQCSQCNGYFSDSECKNQIEEPVVIPAGHTMVHYNEKPATCADTGYSEHWKCSVCGIYSTNANGTNTVSWDSLVLPVNKSNHITLPVKYAHDDSGHWQVCNNCGHRIGFMSDAHTGQTCLCGFNANYSVNEKSMVVGGTTTYNYYESFSNAYTDFMDNQSLGKQLTILKTDTAKPDIVFEVGEDITGANSVVVNSGVEVNSITDNGNALIYLTNNGTVKTLIANNDKLCLSKGDGIYNNVTNNTGSAAELLNTNAAYYNAADGSLTANAAGASVSDVKVGDIPFSVISAQADKNSITYGDTVNLTASSSADIPGTPVYCWYDNSEFIGTGTSLSTSALQEGTRIVSFKMKMTVNGVERTQSKNIVVRVAPKTLTVSQVEVADKRFDNTTDAVVENVVFNGLVNNDTFVMGEDYTATAAFENATVGNNKNVNVTIKLKNENYTFAGNKVNTTATATANILDPRKTPVISVDSINAVYTGSEIPASAIKGTATFDNQNVEGVWSWKDGNAPKNVADSTSASQKWYVVFNPTDSDTYASVEAEVDVTITPKAITISNVKAVSRAYEKGNTTVVLKDGTLEGVAVSDEDNISFNPGNGTVETPNAENAKPVSNINIVLTGSAAANYTLTQPTGITVDITPKEVVATVTVIGSYTYTGNPVTPTVTVKDGSDVIAENEYTVSVTNNINASTETSKAVVTINDKPQGNYMVSGSTEFSIARKDIADAVIVLGANPTYDGNMKTQTVASVTLEDNLNVDTYNVVSGNTGMAADEYTLVIEGTGNFTGTASQTWNILKANPVLRNAPVAKEQCVYTGSDMQLITAGEVNNGTLYYRLGTSGEWKANAADIKAAYSDTYNVYYYVKGNTNYNDIGSETNPIDFVEVEISRAEPNITKLPSAYSSLTYTGGAQSVVSPGETDSGKFMYKLGINGEWQESPYNIKVTDAGTYTVYYYVKGDSNHMDSEVDNFPVVMNKLPVKINNVTLKEKTYNGNTNAEIDEITFYNEVIEFSFKFINPDDIYNAEAKFTEANAGTNKEAVTTVTLTNPNFTFRNNGSEVTTETFTGYYTVKKANQNIVAADINGVYGETDKQIVPTGTYGNVGYAVKNGADIVTVDNQGNLTFLKAGTATVTVTAEGDDNHNSADVDVTVNVEKAVATVTALNKTAFVGSSAPDFTAPVLGTDYKIEGLIGEDELDGEFTVSLTCNADMEVAGNYDIVPEVNVTVQPTNYRFETQNGVLTVNKFSGGGGGGVAEPVYDVNIPDDNPNGNVKVDVDSASAGDTVTITVTPDTGYALESVTVTDEKGNELEVTDLGNGKYSFEMPEGNVKIETVFMEDNDIINNFVDVTPEDYFYNAVQWAVKNGITTGIDDLHFDPNGDCSRAQLVTFLWRAAGEPAVDYTVGFTDVDADSYYAPAVSWAASLGIVKGYDNTTFGVNDAITREQMATILYRFASSQGVDISVGENTNILSYTDALKISEYAVPAIQWAVGSGIMQGADGKLMPGESCTRAQIVTMLYRLLG